MDKKEAIQRSLKGIIDKQQGEGSFFATVTAVDKGADTIDVVDSVGNEVFNVRLKAVIDGKTTGIVTYPALQSAVIVAAIANSKNTFYVLGITEAESVLVRVGETKKVAITANEIVFDQGNNNGLVKVTELVQKMNQLENTLNALSTAFKIHSHTGHGVPTVTPAPAQIAPTTQTEIENEKVKH